MYGDVLRDLVQCDEVRDLPSHVIVDRTPQTRPDFDLGISKSVEEDTQQFLAALSSHCASLL